MSRDRCALRVKDALNPRPGRLAQAASSVIKRSVMIAGHATSISLEEPFWEALKALAAERGVSVAMLAAEVDQARDGANLSSALRVLVLRSLQDRLGQNISSPGISSPAPAGGTGAPGRD